MALDKTQIDTVEYNMYFDGFLIGYVKMDSTAADVGMKYVKVEDAAQFQGCVAAWKTGAAPMVKFTMLQTGYSSLIGRLGGEQFFPIVDGSRLSWGLGARKVAMFQRSKPLRLHPVGTDANDFANDVYFHLSYPDFGSVSYKGSRDKAQEVEMSFVILPDDTKSLDLTYGVFGDWTAVPSAPQFMFISTESVARAPYMHASALTLLSNQEVQVFSQGFYYTLSTTVTAAVNEGAGVTATEFIFSIDTISLTQGFAIGDYLIVGTEVMQITDITYTGASAADVTVYRHIGGSAAATHADDAVITLLENVYVINTTNRSTWASTAGDDVSVGDSNALDNKGLLAWVSAGSDVITAAITDSTPTTTTSAGLTATAAA